MNENISHNFFIWEEKNSTEPQKNYKNNDASETKDTTNDIQTNVENLHWKDITDPKLREKMRKKEYYQNNKDILKVNHKNYWESNKENINAKSKNRRDNNKDKEKIYHKKYREQNKSIIKEKKRIRYQKEKEKINRENKVRYNQDVNFKLKCRLRHRVRMAIKNNYKAGSAVKDLGCTIEQLKQYLESKFQLGMSWDNHTIDGWHIDHIKPLSSFDLSDRKQLLEACHYTNLQPLWAKDNLTKNDKII
jgi:hypothetical protein